MWCYTLFPVILNMTLTASVAILLVAVARLVLRAAPRAVSYALWLVVLFRLLCPVSFSSPLSVFHAMTVPAHSGCPRDVALPRIRFVLPEDLRIEGADGARGCRRHFVVRTSSRYVDSVVEP